MKKVLLTIVAFWFFIVAFVPNIFAQNDTKLRLPNGVKARFGKGILTHITFSPDMKLLAAASSIGIWIYDTQTGKTVDLLTGHTYEVYGVSFSLDGKMIASLSRDRTVLLWE